MTVPQLLAVWGGPDRKRTTEPKAGERVISPAELAALIAARKKRKEAASGPPAPTA